MAMNTNEALGDKTTGSSSVPNLDRKLEVVVIPVSDVDRAKKFYSKLGWRLDADRAEGGGSRLVQFTPSGSGSSIQFGINLTSAAPGSVQNLLLVVSDIGPRASNLPRTVSTRPKSFIVISAPLAGSRESVPASAECIPRISATVHLFRSKIQMVIVGYSRR